MAMPMSHRTDAFTAWWLNDVSASHGMYGRTETLAVPCSAMNSIPAPPTLNAHWPP
jgi:hypothetical protein